MSGDPAEPRPDHDADTVVPSYTARLEAFLRFGNMDHETREAVNQALQSLSDLRVLAAERFNEIARAREIVEELKREREACLTQTEDKYRLRAAEVLAKYNTQIGDAPLCALAAAMHRLATLYIRRDPHHLPNYFTQDMDKRTS